VEDNNFFPPLPIHSLYSQSSVFSLFSYRASQKKITSLPYTSYIRNQKTKLQTAFLLKTEIHTHILNTTPFLYDSRGLRGFWYKMGVYTHKFINTMTHNWPESLKGTSSCPVNHWQTLTDPDSPQVPQLEKQILFRDHFNHLSKNLKIKKENRS